MEIRPTPEQQAFIRDAIASGRFENAEDAGEEAMALWEERERRRAEILAAAGKAKASIAQGKGRVITHESMRERKRGKFPGERRWIYAGAGRMRLARGGIFGPGMPRRAPMNS